MLVRLTLNDVGDHESSAGVVTDEATAGQVAFDLQSEQIPGDDTTQTEIEEGAGGEARRRGRRL